MGPVLPGADHLESRRLRGDGLDTDIHMVSGKHFLQENSYVEIAQRVAELAAAGPDI